MNVSHELEEEFVIQGLNVSGIFYPFCNVCDPAGPPSPSYKVYNMVMTGILLPCVGLFGVLGNTISAFVFTRKSMVCSMNLYMSALAVSDICVITTAFFLFFMEGMRRYNATIAYMFGAGAPVFFPAGLAAQTCSVYFTVAAAIDCFLQVIVVIVVLSAGYNVSHCFEVSVIECYDPKFAAVSLQVCMTEFRANELYLQIYYVWLYTIVMACGPLVVLVLLNAVIIVALALKKRKKEKGEKRLPSSSTNGHAPLLHHHPPQGDEEEEEEEEVDAITLVLVVFLFIFCNSLALIINFLEQTYYDQLGEALNYLVDVSNLFVVCNSSANILFYYFFGDSFRRTLNSVCSRHCRRSPQAVGNGKGEVGLRGLNGALPSSPTPSRPHSPYPSHPHSPSPEDDGISASLHFYLEELIDQDDIRVHTHLV